MKAPLAVFGLAAMTSALVINAPSTTAPGVVTLTYISQPADPKGSLTFWISHPFGIGGFTGLADKVPPNPGSTPVALTVVIPADFECVAPAPACKSDVDLRGQYFISAGVTGET
ncbi:hypothetical protein B0H12DRAFT_372537 [Mycena haematopus]|nr:hypothetical protein B0H12DRAFT_372537 [Mycena haematopus]